MQYKSTIIIISCLLTLNFSVKAQQNEDFLREQIDLSGTWKLLLDPSNRGIKENWQDSSFTEEVKLPGSLEENSKGNKVEQASNKYLNQTWQYVGAAWYQKEIEIPESWENKQVQLFLERTKVTKIWIDGTFVGGSTLLSAPQVFPLTQLLTPGKHRLTIMVNNSHKLVSVGGSHALSEHTQTNWNGIIGRLHLEAAGNLRIQWVKVTPDAKKKVANVRIRILNNSDNEKVDVELGATSFNSEKTHTAKPLKFKIRLEGKDSIYNFSYPLGEDALLWDEYHPALYKLSVNLIEKRKAVDRLSVNFGLREFKAVGTQFRINDIITFLRGKNDGCIFPFTGYPPADTASWRKLYRTAKSYGINHYRFHSYTPPEAAFEAADVEGIYIQTELPNWSNFSVKDTFQTNFQYREGLAILDAYANHPSFVMLSLGNELAGDSVVHNKLVRDLKQHDSRPLFAYGTNAFYADPKPGEGDDFWVTMRTGKESSKKEFDVRGSFATTEDPDNGIINSGKPSTRYNFASAIKDARMPVVGHETGQYQIYPDFSEMPKYTGILKPLNFGIFKKRLEDAGMGDQADSFFKASGKLTALLYREEIEMAFRTPGFAGFQLLDLQDYPGQGTALVGLLNAFMESKGLITEDEFKSFNNDVVLQLLMDKYTWTNNETYNGDINLVNYSPDDIRGRKLSWTINNGNRKIATGTIDVSLAEKGKINSVGKISFPLQSISNATKLMIRLELDQSSYKTEYPVWVYPNTVNTNIGPAVKIATKLDENTIEELNRGGNVILFPNHEEIKDKSVGPQFISEFWNWLVFKGAAKNMKRPESAGTLGILTDPAHPLFTFFPTEYHTNWQWWSITKNARPLILDITDTDYRPIVQVIDNIDRNHKLGMIFEFKAGNGKLLISMANLPEMLDKPEARQLYYSMLKYAESNQFNPSYPISLIKLKELL